MVWAGRDCTQMQQPCAAQQRQRGETNNVRITRFRSGGVLSVTVTISDKTKLQESSVHCWVVAPLGLFG